MRKAILAAAVSVVIASPAFSANVVRQTMAIENNASPQVACNSPRFNFSRKDVGICIDVYQGCMRADLNQAERDQCIVDAVEKARAAARAGGGRQARGPKEDAIEFTFNSFQAVDLIEICEQRQNRKRPLCAGAILPNKARIISDINRIRQ